MMFGTSTNIVTRTKSFGWLHYFGGDDVCPGMSSVGPFVSYLGQCFLLILKPKSNKLIKHVKSFNNFRKTWIGVVWQYVMLLHAGAVTFFIVHCVDVKCRSESSESKRIFGMRILL